MSVVWFTLILQLSYWALQSSNYDHQDRLKVLIITSRNKLNPIWVSQLKRYLNSEEISIPQSPLLHDGPQSRPQTPESPISPTSSESDIAGHISDTHLKYMQRLVGFWYRVKGVNVSKPLLLIFSMRLTCHGRVYTPMMSSTSSPCPILRIRPFTNSPVTGLAILN